MKLKTVLIGLGRIGWQLEMDSKRYHPCTHAGTLKFLSSKFELIGVCDRNLPKIQKFLQWWGGSISFHIDYQQLLKDLKDSIDLVIIATGPDSHISILEYLQNFHISRILIEKPIAHSTSSLSRIRDSIKNKIFVNFERRYHLPYQKVKEIMERNVFGELLSVYAKVLAPSLRRDPLLEDAIHILDLILWYIGYPEILYSYWENNHKNIEERSYHILKKNQTIIILESGGKRKYFEFSLTLEFQKGKIQIGNHGFYLFRNSVSRKYEKFYELKPLETSIPFLNPWVRLYECIYHNQNFSDFNMAYKGIQLYEDLKHYSLKVN